MDTNEQAILGTGWNFPPEFIKESENSVVLANGATDIRQSLWIVLSTALGERIMQPQFGSQIWEMVFHGIDTALMTQLREMVRQAILSWEPRVDVTSIDIQPEAGLQGVVRIDVGYVIRQTNARSNLVYPFYIDQGTIPPQAP